jgi:RHS repeat-associated protein
MNEGGVLTAVEQCGGGVLPACRGLGDFGKGSQAVDLHGIGWTLQPDARHSVFFEIVSITASEIEVRGDAESQMPHTPGTEDGPVWYFIIPPVGVDKEDGALDLGTHAYPSLYLAFHYRYIRPLVGVSVTTTENPYLSQDGIYGAQSPEFINRQGQYQAWHRYYNPVTGRWTTPDPAAMPWTNLLTYVGENPVNRSDPSGLQSRPTPEIPVPTPGESDPVRDTLDRIADVCVDIILLPFRAIAWFFGWLFGGSGDLSDAERLARCIERCDGHHKHRVGVCKRQLHHRYFANEEHCIEDSEMRYERCLERCER